MASLFDTENIADYQTNNTDNHTHHHNPKTNDFQIVLLVLMAAVAKADGKVEKTELSVIKRFLIQNYGEEAAREALRLAMHKLPCKCKIVSKADLEGGVQ